MFEIMLPSLVFWKTCIGNPNILLDIFTYIFLCSCSCRSWTHKHNYLKYVSKLCQSHFFILFLSSLFFLCLYALNCYRVWSTVPFKESLELGWGKRICLSLSWSFRIPSSKVVREAEAKQIAFGLQLSTLKIGGWVQKDLHWLVMELPSFELKSSRRGQCKKITFGLQLLAPKVGD
jgi:hypothetical protein